MKNKYKIQHGSIAYSDLNKPARPLFSKRYMIAGKPDYIVKNDGNYIPVEFKASKYENPQKNHIFQLAAYCHLVEENYGGFVPYGVLVYNNNNNNSQHKIAFNPGIRFDLESTLKDMRHIIRSRDVMRNHNDLSRCRNCSMKSYCDKRIV